MRSNWAAMFQFLPVAFTEYQRVKKDTMSQPVC